MQVQEPCFFNNFSYVCLSVHEIAWLQRCGVSRIAVTGLGGKDCLLPLNRVARHQPRNTLARTTYATLFSETSWLQHRFVLSHPPTLGVSTRESTSRRVWVQQNRGNPQDCTSVPCTLYTLANPLLASLGLSHLPYPCFIHITDPHVRVLVPDPARLTRQDPDIIYYLFGSVAMARRPISISPTIWKPSSYSTMYVRCSSVLCRYWALESNDCILHALRLYNGPSLIKKAWR